MDEIRRGEIALKLVRHMARKHGITLSQNKMRELRDVATAIGVPMEQLKQFIVPIIQEIFDERSAAK